MLTGTPGAITPAIMASPKVRKITFTGSIPVGKMLIQQSAETVKRVTMGLGGHAPVIVHDDVDVTAAAHISAVAKFRNSGQVCASPTRFYVHESKIDAFGRALAERSAQLHIGDPLDADNDIGPLTMRRRRDAVEALIEALARPPGRQVHQHGLPAVTNGIALPWPAMMHSLGN